MGKRKEERIEIHERLIVRTASGSLPALCDECSVRDSILLSPEQAAVVTDIPERLIYQWVEAGAIHYAEAPNGKLTRLHQDADLKVRYGLRAHRRSKHPRKDRAEVGDLTDVRYRPPYSAHGVDEKQTLR